MKKYREGPVGALMDEYERAAAEYKRLVLSVSLEEFLKILDSQTKDPDCVSIQSITNHVIRAGYGYANYIRKQFGESLVERKEYYEIPEAVSAAKELDGMMAYTVETLQDKWALTFEDLSRRVIKTKWGQVYDFEQLLEHAIVHILRHRRQIEKLMHQN